MSSQPLRQSPDQLEQASAMSIEQVRDMIASHQEPYYVYLLCRPNGEPFYVGKGVGERIFTHERDARNLPSHRSHKLNLIRAIRVRGQEVCYRIDGFFDGEDSAHRREVELIESIGRHDQGRGPLTNQTDGGEGTSNPSETSLERRAATLSGNADDPDRRAANEFFHSFGNGHASVPIKPCGCQRLVPLTPHPKAGAPTRRSAQALLTCAVSRQILLAPGCEIPRIFVIGSAKVAIENGAGRLILKSGLATLLPNTRSAEGEVFVLTDRGFNYLIQSFGTDRLLELGVIEPRV